MRYISLFSMAVALMALSGCGTMKGAANDIQIVGKNIGAVATGNVVPAFDEEGNPQFSVGEMPKGYNYADNPADFDRLENAVNRNGVRLYNDNTGFGGGNSTSIPNFSGGINAANSSVTIFPLNQEMRNTFEGQAPAYQGVGNPHGFSPLGNTSFGNNSDAQIYFRHGSSRLGSGDLRKISSAAQKSGPITVEGYASRPTQAGKQSVRAHILNLKESMNRSFAVSRALLKKGVPASNITTVSHGAAKASGNSSQDRRVDIVTGY